MQALLRIDLLWHDRSYGSCHSYIYGRLFIFFTPVRDYPCKLGDKRAYLPAPVSQCIQRQSQSSTPYLVMRCVGCGALLIVGSAAFARLLHSMKKSACSRLLSLFVRYWHQRFGCAYMRLANWLCAFLLVVAPPFLTLISKGRQQLAIFLHPSDDVTLRCCNSSLHKPTLIHAHGKRVEYILPTTWQSKHAFRRG